MDNKIAIISCDKWKGKIKEDLMLQKELLENGIKSEIISWQDNSINYSEYAFLIMRSVWGYQNYYSQFKNWLITLKENNIKIFNNIDIILNNIRKDKQLQILDKYSFPHIPTTIIKELCDLKSINGFEIDMVLKPIISGSGENTFFVSQHSTKIELQTLINKCIPIIEQTDNGIMLQPFIPEIKNGEYACIFVDGKNTHNMLRFPGVLSEKKQSIYLPSIPKQVFELATSISEIPEFKDYLYMRVDIIVSEGQPYIMEVELAEPDLLMKYIEDEKIQKKAIKTFAKRIERRF